MDLAAIAQKIKSRIPLSSVVSAAVKLRGRNANFLGLCPFHSEKTPSFHVRDQVGRFKCFGCGASGDIFEFVMRLQGIAFAEALSQLAERAGVDHRSSVKTPRHSIKASADRGPLMAQKVAQEFFRQQLFSDQSGRAALGYLTEKRGLSENMIAQAGLGFGGKAASKFIDHLKKNGISENCAHEAGLLLSRTTISNAPFLSRITIPIRGVQGDIIAFGARSISSADSAPKYVNTHSYAHYEKRKNLFGIFESKGAVLKGNTLVLVEGYFDAMALWALGMPAVALCGTSFSQDHASIIGKLCGRVILCLDSDEAGFCAMNKVLVELCRRDISAKMVLLEKNDPGAYLSDDSLSELKRIFLKPHDAISFVVDQAVVKANGGSVSERIEHIDSLLPIFAAIKRPLLRRQYVWYLANRLHEDPSILWNEVQQRIRKIKKPKEDLDPASNRESRELLPQERLLFSLIILYPDLLDEVARSFADISKEMESIIVESARLMREENQELALSSIVSHVREEYPNLWPGISELLWDRMRISREEALAALSGMSGISDRARLREALRKKRKELQRFEKNGDFSAMLQTLKEHRDLLSTRKNTNSGVIKTISSEEVFHASQAPRAHRTNIDNKNQDLEGLGSPCEFDEDWL